MDTAYFYKGREYNKRKLGLEQEALALKFLEEQGYELVTRNFTCRKGEIDLIMKDGEYLVFIEVKYRSNTSSGYPAEAVGGLKIHRIVESARYYLYKSGLGEDIPLRFDVVSILGTRVSVIKNAF